MNKKGIIKVTERKIIKTLNILSCIGNNNKIYMDDNFYSYFQKYSKIQLNQILNAMQAEGLIKIIKPGPNTLKYISFTQKVFVYKMNVLKAKRKFWIPTIISIISLISSFRKEIFLLLIQLVQLLK